MTSDLIITLGIWFGAAAALALIIIFVGDIGSPD